MKRLAPLAFRGAPCRPGSPPASSAFAALVARYFSPLRTFKQRLTAIASPQSASRTRAVSQSRPARSPGRCWPPAVSRQRANTECNASYLSRLHCSQQPTTRALLPAPAHFRQDHQSRYAATYCFTVGRQRHDHTAGTQSHHHRNRRAADSAMRSCCLSLGNNWQSNRLSMLFVAIQCKADEVRFMQAGVEKVRFSLEIAVFVKVPPVGSGGQRSIQLSYGRTLCATRGSLPVRGPRFNPESAARARRNCLPPHWPPPILAGHETRRRSPPQ